jgi:hypothetical protein
MNNSDHFGYLVFTSRTCYSNESSPSYPAFGIAFTTHHPVGSFGGYLDHVSPVNHFVGGIVIVLFPVRQNHCLNTSITIGVSSFTETIALTSLQFGFTITAGSNVKLILHCHLLCSGSCCAIEIKHRCKSKLRYNGVCVP